MRVSCIKSRSSDVAAGMETLRLFLDLSLSCRSLLKKWRMGWTIADKCVSLPISVSSSSCVAVPRSVKSLMKAAQAVNLWSGRAIVRRRVLSWKLNIIISSVGEPSAINLDVETRLSRGRYSVVELGLPKV